MSENQEKEGSRIRTPHKGKHAFQRSRIEKLKIFQVKASSLRQNKCFMRRETISFVLINLVSDTMFKKYFGINE